MNINDPSLLIILVSSFTLTLSFMMLYFTNERQRYLLMWTAAWGIYFLRFIVLLSASLYPSAAKFIIMYSEILAVINCYLLLYGIYTYDKKSIHPGWLYAAAVTVIWIIAAPFLGLSFTASTLPQSFFLFIAYSYTGVYLISGIKSPGIERIIAGVLFILWGLHRLDYPFLWTYQEFRKTGYILGALLSLLIALSTIIAYLQDTRRLFISEKLKAEESDRLKSSFLANMSHEIRTPLNAILGFTQLLGRSDLSADDKAIFIQNIQNSGKKLLSLIDDILDLSKIEAGVLKIYMSDVSINRIIDELFSETSLAQKVADKRIRLIPVKALDDGNDIIRTDETRLYQILSNLMNNAVKFTESGIVTAGYETDEPGFIRFFVKDTGIGISEEFFDKLFTPFLQEGKAISTSGTGLGLSISRGFIESLGGRIKIKSRENEGTEIYFTIPLVKGAEVRPVKTFTGSADLYKITGKKILLVEDEPVNRRLIEKFIESTGADLISTASGNEAVRFCITDRNIDLVLMDLTLPDLDGYSAISAIKKERPNLPIIVQSANAMPEHRDRAKQSGADSFIAKPIKREELYDAIWTQLFDRQDN